MAGSVVARPATPRPELGTRDGVAAGAGLGESPRRQLLDPAGGVVGRDRDGLLAGRAGADLLAGAGFAATDSSTRLFRRSNGRVTWTGPGVPSATAALRAFVASSNAFSKSLRLRTSIE